MPIALAVALGGGLGSVGRYAVDSLIERHTESVFPWATFTINMTGCLAVGFLIAALVDRHTAPAWLRAGCSWGSGSAASSERGTSATRRAGSVLGTVIVRLSDHVVVQALSLDLDDRDRRICDRVDLGHVTLEVGGCALGRAGRPDCDRLAHLGEPVPRVRVCADLDGRDPRPGLDQRNRVRVLACHVRSDGTLRRPRRRAPFGQLRPTDGQVDVPNG